MARLDAEARNDLSDGDFAYIDSDGGRHLPIHDEGHIRAAMARFDQTHFESDAAKAAARRKIISAAHTHGIDTAGFEGKAASEQFDDPDSSDTHLDAALGSAPQKKRSKMLTRLVRRVRQHFSNHPAMTADQFEGHFRHALSHAGGMARAESRQGADPLIPLSAIDDIIDAILGPDDHDCDDDMDGDADASDVLAMLAQAHSEERPHVTSDAGTGFRLFLPVAFAEGAEWIPYLPTPGEWNHPRYGKISITPQRNADFVQKFNSGVYQSQVPLDAEHQTKLSGAMAWIKELRQNSDGSVDARVDWTDRGAAMRDRYRYISPEFFDEWADPKTGETITNVAIGGALTSRPFFKESSLRPLVATETGIEVPEDNSPTGTEPDDIRPNGQGENRMAEESQLTEDQAKAFAELSERVASIERERDEAKAMAERLETEAKTAAERVAALETENRRKVFAEQASQWFGETEKHVSFMESLTDEARAFYIEQQNAVAEQLRQSKLFTAIGVSGDAGSQSAQQAFDGKVKALAASENIDYGTAATRIAASEPDLYAAAQAETRVRA